MAIVPGDALHPISFTLNGESVTGHVVPRLLLTDFLRQQLGATGTHVGCEHGVCGACTIAVDGAPTRACLMLAIQVDGCVVTTVEGIGASDGLSVLQQTFKTHFALQCGYCTPGILMSAHLWLRDHPDPTEQEIRQMLSGHLCRCTGYTPIVRAISAAADALRDTTHTNE